MPGEDDTNPGTVTLGALFRQGESTQTMVKANTDKIACVDRKLGIHLEGHKVVKEVKKEGREKLVSVIKIIGVVFGILIVLMGLVWTGATYLEAKAAAISRANGYHPRPVVEYSEDEDP